jgi:hypothetical protein
MSASVQKLTRSEREAPLLYSQRRTLIGGCGKPWHFKSLTVRHSYYQLAQSSGKLYELLKALKALDGDRTKKLFQFLNEIGASALCFQLGRVWKWHGLPWISSPIRTRLRKDSEDKKSLS